MPPLLPWAATLKGNSLFLQSHTSHHKAIISLLLEQTDIKAPEEFGYALSTKAYRQKHKIPAD